MKQILFILLAFISFQGFAQESVKFKNIGLEIMTKTFGPMNWNEAQALCDSMGNGWRLPKGDEFNKLGRLRTLIGGINKGDYWGKEIDEDYAFLVFLNETINSNPDANKYSLKNKLALVRLVRDNSIQSFSPETIKLKSIGLEIMKKDIGQCDNAVAKEICKMIGDEWRLPTKDELIKMYKLRVSIGGFRDYGRGYWTSSNYGEASRWCVDFSDGEIYFDAYYSDGQLRAVRTLK